MSDQRISKFKYGTRKLKFQTRPGPALICIPEKSDGQRAQISNAGSSDEKNDERSKIASFCFKFYHRLQLKHLGLVVITIIYAFLGGWLFSWLELKNEMKVKSDTVVKLKDTAYTLSGSILSTCENSTITDEDKRETILKLVQRYQKDVKLVPNNTTTKWDFWGSMFFAGTVFTTIGYGHYVPVTRAGRIAVMMYAVFGIPLVLAMLNDFGKLLTNWLNNFWSRLHRVVLSKCCKVNEEIIQNDIFSFPIPLALFLIVGWIFFCSALFCIWETTWSYFEAFYFFFVSLSTVGLGDITPRHPKFMICAFPLVVIGLSLVSLVINLIQNYVEKLKDKTAGFVDHQFEVKEETDSEDGDESPNYNRNNSQRDKAEKVNRTAIGIIQSVHISNRIPSRRRIGVQTEESCLPRFQVNDDESDRMLIFLQPMKDNFSEQETIFYDADVDY